MSTEIQKTNQQVTTIIDFDAIQFNLQKKYLEEDISILPINDIQTSEDLITQTRFFELEKFVYEKDIKISYKLKSVFSALHSVNSSVIFKIVSNGTQCTIYIGVKSKAVTNASKVLTGALKGNFPGTIFVENEGSDGALKNDEVSDLQNKILNDCKEITAVVGTPSLKDQEEDQFIQGIENLILGMNGKPFTAIFIGDPVPANQVEFTLDTYEQIYSVLSSEKEFVITDGENESNSTSFSTSIGSTSSTSASVTEGTNESTTTNSGPWFGRKLMNGFFGTGSKNADSISHGLEWSLNTISKVLDLTIGNDIRNIQTQLNKEPDFKIKPDLKTKTDGSKTKGTNHSETTSTVEGTSKNTTEGENTSTGTSKSHQKTFTNKKVSNFLDRLDKQIERLEQGKGIGFWNVGAYFISNEAQNGVIAANIYNGVIKGAESNFETAVVKTFNSINANEREKVKEYLQNYQIPQLHNYGYLAQPITTDELTVQINFPHKSVVGLDVVEITPFGNNPEKEVKNNIKIGKLYNYDQIFTNDIVLDFNKFTSHIFVTGSTGSGKSNVTYNLIDKLCEKNINFLVIEPTKGEYKDEFGGRKNVAVYGTNPNYTQLLKINPFAFQENIHVYEHIDRFIEILNACWPMEAAMPNLLKEAVEDAYISKGWLLDESRCIADKKEYPLFLDLLKSLENVIENSDFSHEVKSNYQGALVTRVRSMTNGLNKLIFTNECISEEDLFDKNVIVDLSRVASSEGKALFMGILFMKLNEYRITNKNESNSNLKHITILEEAHNLLKRTSTDQSADGANLAGKSVEMISNAIAEMRTYGEGFIIADQAPGLLDMSVIRNTNTKICLRLPDFEDRKLVGNAMNLNENQIKELANLETGVAAIYQNDWQEAILCKFDKFEFNPNHAVEIF
ncbi:ATP-binding protein [Chryseobacterium sp. RR2-3-20]|uniref:ATP-binding protein n=1 Tax=Chryseobacterium sp. RR2-3-20 TaxID=2787626 RepID=UPI001ADEE282|nr:ATP-binding protein [Chryseobacterium sp. RR2-3-20]